MRCTSSHGEPKWLSNRLPVANLCRSVPACSRYGGQRSVEFAIGADLRLGAWDPLSEFGYGDVQFAHPEPH